jgi:flagellar biosynthesis/type III secretory pathway protein FliH
MSELQPLRVADIRLDPGFRPLRRPPVNEPQAAEQPSIAANAADPFDEGYRQGQSDCEQAFAAERERYRTLIAACEAFQPEPSEPLALFIAETVEILVRTTVGEVSVDKARLIERARIVADLVSELDGTRLIHLNPADCTLIEPCSLPLAVVADTSVTPGSLRIEHAAGWIEDGVEVHLDALREQLGLKEGRQ